MIQQPVLIAGQYSGMRVWCTHDAYKVFNQLTTMAKNANYWAQLITKGIRGLRNGAINSDDVFVRSIALNGGGKEYFIILPGCKVTAEHRTSGDYMITRIEACTDFVEKQEAFKKPGLFDAERNDVLGWRAKYVKTGNINGQRLVNVVGISDSGYEAPREAMILLTDRIKASVTTEIEKLGYDFWFTPGKKRIGGLLNYRRAINAASSPDLHESAIMLANTMIEARKYKEVVWFSDMGGSGVLTQAMKILSNRQIKLEGHKIFLHRPTTRKDTAYSLSKDLGMTVDRDFVKSNSANINEFVGAGSLTLPFKRYKREDNYNGVKLAKDLFREVIGGHKSWKTTAGLYGTVAGLAATSSVMTLPAMVTVGGAILTAYNIGMANSPDIADRINKFLKENT